MEQITINNVTYNIKYKMTKEGDSFVDKNSNRVCEAGAWDIDNMNWIIQN